MSSVSSEHWQLASALAAGRISNQEFCDALSTKADDAAALGFRWLKTALAEHDPEGVEFGLFIGHRFGFIESHLQVLLRLADEGWHTQHENVVDGLAVLHSPLSVDTLYRTALARFEYLEYDEAFALGVKCIWALGALKSEDAVVRLRELSSCGNQILEENARAQLARLREENPV